MRKLVTYLPSAALIAILALGLPVFLHYSSAPAFKKLAAERQPVHDLLTGVTAGKLERVYKDEFPIREFATGSLNALSLGVFGEARKGVVVGADNWFFSDEEFTWNRRTPDTIERNLDFVNTVSKDLAQKDIRLVVALIPEKADIYRDKLGPIAPPAQQGDGYHIVRGRLEAMSNVVVPDLQSSFMKKKLTNQLFLKSDTHWTLDGAAIAAEGLARSIPADLEISRAEYDLKNGDKVPYYGDLYKFVRLSVFDPYFKLPPDLLGTVTAVPKEEDLDMLLGDASGTDYQVAVVGTSYSANSRWGFIDQLKAALSADVLNLAQEGEGPFAPMQKFLSESLEKNSSIKLVIWEVPLRYFSQLPSEAGKSY